MDESDIDQLEASLEATKKAGKTYLQIAFTKFIFNWTLLTFFYLISLYFFPFLKWVSPILILLITYSLYSIYIQNKQFYQKIEDMHLLIAEIKGTQ